MIRDNDAIFDDAERTGGVFEPESVAFWKKHLKPGQWAFDIGAYTGLYTLIAGKAGCHAYGFEPNPLNITQAIENRALNELDTDTTHFMDIAISDTKGERSFFFNVHGLSSVGSLTPVFDPRYSEKRIETMTLDWHFSLDAPVCAIKMDTEGYEENVLRGAVQILKKWKPGLIIELATMDHIRLHKEFLKPYGYTFFERVDDRNLICE